MGGRARWYRPIPTWQAQGDPRLTQWRWRPQDDQSRAHRRQRRSIPRRPRTPACTRDLYLYSTQALGRFRFAPRRHGTASKPPLYQYTGWNQEQFRYPAYFCCHVKLSFMHLYTKTVERATARNTISTTQCIRFYGIRLFNANERCLLMDSVK